MDLTEAKKVAEYDPKLLSQRYTLCKGTRRQAPLLPCTSPYWQFPIRAVSHAYVLPLPLPDLRL